MNSRIWTAGNRFRRLLSASSIAVTGFFGLGLFLGTVAVSMWQQWSLTFGLDPQFLLAVSIVLSVSFMGSRRQRVQEGTADGQALAYLIICLSACSLLHPFWIEALTMMMAQLSLSWLENETSKPFVALAFALAGWTVPGILWSSVVARGALLSRAFHLTSRQAFASIFCGIASGLLLNALLVAPQVGVYVPTIVAAIVATGAGLRLRHIVVPQGISEEADVTSRAGQAIAVRVPMALLAGGLLACNLRLVNQLMPHGAFVIYCQAAGIMFGIAAGLIAIHVRAMKARASWAGMFVAASASLLLAIQPWLVDLSLWLNSSVMAVWLLLAFRALLLMAVAFPFGLGLAWVIDSSDKEPKADLVAWGLPFGIGVGIATFVLGGNAGIIAVMAVCGSLLVFAAGTLYVHTFGLRTSFRTTAAMGSLASVAFSLPLWRSCDDAARTAKLLYSTPTLLAYRFGWDIEHLPYLDDVRMVDRCEGNLGPLTLWRGRVAELYVREAGIPRSVLTKNSDAVPQFAPEVLQVVYSMVMCERPNRVLFLGLSAGVPLSTCLSFPIREAVCVEGDANLISLVQGPLARELGFDPLTDDRVSLRRVSPELALLAEAPEPFDVIMSNPPGSSMTSGAALFTEEFYQRASRQLAERGLFCQRFECVDFGIEPIQLVVKSMRNAFRYVMAIEPAAGEFLLFGTNSDEVFVPGDLAARLEAPHVCRILARSGMDWSVLLNLPTFDHDALGEICDESNQFPNTSFNGQFAAMAPMEVMRWGNKLQEVQTALTATRTSKAAFWRNLSGEPNLLDDEMHLSRRSRLIEWLGDARVSKELMRRLEEVLAQHKLVRDNPDAHWWASRNTLRKQLQNRPRTSVQQVKHIDEKVKLHPEDVRRRDYFVALGNAVRREHPSREQIGAVEKYLQPYDPLLSYFARQEIADLLARSGEDPARELAYRLHVIYFAPTIDASVRNVANAIEMLVKHPEAVPDDSNRFDVLNGLMQTLRVRWEIRQSVPDSNSTKALDDVNQSLLAIENGITALDAQVASAGIASEEWRVRKDVIERLMIRPLRSYRNEVQSKLTRGQATARAIIEEANKPKDPSDFEE